MSNGTQFLNWVFFEKSDELLNLRDQQTIKLEPQVAQLLKLFIEKQNELLTRDELFSTIWPDVVVEHNSLYQLLTKLRRLLNDNPKRPEIIKTIPKKGYQFIATTSLYLHCEGAEESVQSIPKTKNKTPWWKLAILPIFIACTSAIAFYSQKTIPEPQPEYVLSDLSYDLGLEYNVAAHVEKDLIAYIKDFNHLTIANKQGVVLNSIEFPSRIRHPSWHPTQDLLTFWQYNEDQCILHVYKSSGQPVHRAKGLKCSQAEVSTWQSDQDIVVSIAKDKQYQAYLYNITQSNLQPLPIPLKKGERFRRSIQAWQDKIYYLITSEAHHSKLVTLDGTIHMQWQHPITLLAYDPKHQRVISNSTDKHHTLISTTRDGQSYVIANSLQGLFTALSIDKKGDIYSAVETWQVNIRDKDELPIFSTASIDYLPVSNPIGETAFMSRRSGVCEIYLFTDDQVKQLSYYRSYDYVKHIEWQPKLNLLLSNRDNDLYLHDRQGTVMHFTPALTQPLSQFGWLTDQQIWAYDKNALLTYDLNGNLLKKRLLKVDALLYDHTKQQWLLFHNHILYRVINSDVLSDINQWQAIAPFTPQQYNQMRNFRLREGNLYWLSSWSAKDYIWQVSLTDSHAITLIKSDELIWHYDIAQDNSLNIAKMEAIEGDIKKLSLVMP